jgi:hypothetical protein
METPVALFFFKRPDTTRQVFEAIRKSKPKKLFLISDAPFWQDKAKNEECKNIVGNVDWECTVYTNYSEFNQGCDDRITSGIDWVFTYVEECIFFEDDCLPDPTFFQFCEEMLEKYRDDKRIMMISGNNFQYGRKRTEYSYYYSQIFHIWGWATWKRAWKHYDHNVSFALEVIEGGWLPDLLAEPNSANFFSNILFSNYLKQLNTWDFKWNFSCWVQNGLSVMPNQSLVSNIGFGADATHAFNPNDPLANIPNVPMDFPLRHPPFIVQDKQADRDTMNRIFR